MYREYEGELAVIDFKTSEKIKPEKWLENYFVQELLCCCYYELTGIPVKKLITIMSLLGGCKSVDKRNKGDYIKLLVRYIKEFVLTILGQNAENELEKVLQSKFFALLPLPKRLNCGFKNADMNYIDAIVHFCEQNNLDLNLYRNLYLNL